MGNRAQMFTGISEMTSPVLARRVRRYDITKLKLDGYGFSQDRLHLALDLGERGDGGVPLRRDKPDVEMG